MNLTDVLTQIQLNEGLFLQGKYKDKGSLITSAINIIYDVFSKPIAEELLEGLSRTEFKTMPLFSRDRKNTGAYTNNGFINDIREFIDSHKEDYYKKPKGYNKLIKKNEKEVQRNLGSHKVVLNPRIIKEQGDNYALIIAHELIHVAYPYSKDLVKACEDIYDIFKNNWNPESGTFYISKVLRGTLDRENSSSKKSEILPYIISDNIHTEFLTEEGTQKLINYLKGSGLLNLEGQGKIFWDNEFQKMIENNKKGVPDSYRKIYAQRKRMGVPPQKDED